mmetsp:Transcript_7421/g.13181  ORF Transcript_7421/g.13181 Transcript_7421/m.13181 type:complete len:129 (-) Transcript_7421:168-554(-)|eukprot:CAMPEP_0197621060 /NCGR_PEP_ID=MMETSP1338-20131121/1702_1 /TAXON_ID=43686 ORGANISM="Pelagodinium beii, Strain RCC1491" /NCGR_SAMPLE_ID=MMETSP1338 /ASSEMBLY_ACC=CAM_ASM_000754 /LENGTH=128 /DNA_ID=CAMNT_0043190387 /DNA_START=91 /DNA_END=477 /DNA_ORIENTATION=+
MAATKAAIVAFALAACVTPSVTAWDEPLDAVLEDALWADLAAEDLGSDGNALNLLQATAKLHIRGDDGMHSLGAGAALAAAVDDGSAEALEAGSTATSLYQTSAEPVLPAARGARKIVKNKKGKTEEL